MRTRASGHRDLLTCEGCGYGLAGIRVGRCPECARLLTPEQRAALGLPRATDLDRVRMLIEQLRGRGLLSPEACAALPAELEDEGDVDDVLAGTVLGGWPAGERLYRILRRDDWSPAESLSRLLEGVAGLSGKSLTDRGALRLLPTAEACRKLYRKLRELGHGPLEAACRILPHARSYGSGLP